MIRWLLDLFVFRSDTVQSTGEPMAVAVRLLNVCRNIPQAQPHVKEAMRAIFEAQMEKYDRHET